MKNLVISLALITLIISCVGSQKVLTPLGEDSYAIHLTNIVDDEGTLKVNEFRFYEPKSARSAEITMTKKFGKSKVANPGKYQDNIKQFIWKNITLLGDGDTFSIITDGTETRRDYFTAIMVFDQNEVDALSPLYSRRDEIIDSLKSYLKPHYWIR